MNMNNKITAHLKNGALYKIRPLNFKKLYDDRQRAYDARYIVSDGVKYDLRDAESIKCIKIPRYVPNAPIGVTGYLENILLKHVPTGDDRLDCEILLKYTKLLKYSCWHYTDKDYYRLPKRLYELGAFEQGDEALEKIKKYIPKMPDNPLQRNNLKDFVESNRRIYDGDLIEIQASYTRCEKCAIYAGRVYSVNGEDKRFPKCPDWIVEKGAICDNGCGSAIFPFMYFQGQAMSAYTEKYGVPELVEKEPVTYSNRPFVDTRNDAEIGRYQKLKAERETQAIKDKYYMLNYRNFCYEKINNPKKATKTFSGYMRRLNRQGKLY